MNRIFGEITANAADDAHAARGALNTAAIAAEEKLPSGSKPCVLGAQEALEAQEVHEVVRRGVAAGNAALEKAIKISFG